MPNFKVINPDTPEEIDLIQDIPLVDEETGSDQIDSDGNILVKRYVTRTVNLNGINAVKDSLPQIKENAKNLKDLYDYSHSVNADQQTQILENSSKITELLTDTTALEVAVIELENKIKGIQGIDIDDVKADLDALKQSAYLITGGTLKGDISIQTPNTATITLTPSGSSSFAAFSCNNDVLDCTTTWGKLFKQSEEGGFFYGLSSTALADKNGKELTNYISDIMGSNAQLTFIKGDGTSQVISINNVISATKATKADDATNLAGHPVSDFVRSVNGVNADNAGNVQLGNIGAITGEIKWFAFNTAPDGFLVCNGANVSRATYADLFAVIGTTYGKGDGSTTFALPNLIDKFAQGSTTVGTVKDAGLPDITGKVETTKSNAYGTGAFKQSTVNNTEGAALDVKGKVKFYAKAIFYASDSNSIYGNSTTVQPPALTLLPCIKY